MGFPLSDTAPAPRLEYQTNVAGDTTLRFSINESGTIQWGGGAAAPDISLVRPSGGLLMVQEPTGGYAILGVDGHGGTGVGGGASGFAWYRAGTQVFSLYQYNTNNKLALYDGAPSGLGGDAMSYYNKVWNFIGPFIVTNQAPASATLTVKGAGGQTADLLDIVNSAGTVLSSFNSSGALIFSQGGTLRLIPNNSTYGFGLQIDNGLALSATMPVYMGICAPASIVVNGTANHNAAVAATSSGSLAYPIYLSTPSANHTGAHFQAFSAGGTTTEFQVMPGGAVNILPSSATVVPITITQAGSPTVDAIDVKNSSGTVLFAIRNDGSINLQGGSIYQGTTQLGVWTTGYGCYFPLGITVGKIASSTMGSNTINAAGGFGQAGVFGVNAGSTSTTSVGFYIKGASGATVDLLEVGTAASGQPLAGFDAGGRLFIGGTAVTAGQGGSWGGGTGPMMFLANDTADPTTNPTGGGILYVSAGALKYRGPNGTVTTLGVA